MAVCEEAETIMMVTMGSKWIQRDATMVGLIGFHETV